VDEQGLIHRIVAKDATAFRILVERYQSSVLNVCYRILSNEQDAEDITQDVFVMVYRKAESFRGESGLSTWLYRIAVNLSLNRLRKRKWDRLFGILTLSEAESGETADTMEAPEQDRPDRQLEARERSKVLADVLNTLPDKQRVAIILHKIEGLSHQEIAEILQISLSSVESLVHRAKRNLQKKLIPLLGKI
jgi:RNA polymerase sigma-70 factor (ECF subfamily)